MADDPKKPEDYLASIIEKMDTHVLNPHAVQIGFLCIFWSRLEFELTSLLTSLMAPVDLQAAIIVVHNMDFREKIAATLALGFHKKPSDDWFSQLKSTLNEIDNTLRPTRNRWVHDHYLQVGDSVFKLTMKTGVYYEQARKLALRLLDIEQSQPSDIRVTTIGVMTMIQRLVTLKGQLPASPDRSDTPSPVPGHDQDQNPIIPGSPPQASEG